MKTPSICRILSVTVLGTSIYSLAKSPDPADSWWVLNKITHKRSYTIETRDRKCVSGTITRVTADHLTAKVYASNSWRSPDTLTFPRADVLRVTVGRIVYYSGRSSWSDVSSLRLISLRQLKIGQDRLKIVMKDGKVYEVKPPYTVSDEDFTLQISGKSTNVSKTEIAQVYDDVVKPLSEFGEYSLDELGPMVIFDPDWYVWKLHLEQHIPALLYDASAPEDNSPAQCVTR